MADTPHNVATPSRNKKLKTIALCLLLLERFLLILGVGPGPAVSVPGQLRVQQDINLEIRTETSNTGLSALREPWDVILEPPEDDPDLPVPVIARPAVVLAELVVAVSLHWVRVTRHHQVIWPGLQGDTETNQQRVAGVQTFQSDLKPTEDRYELHLMEVRK